MSLRCSSFDNIMPPYTVYRALFSDLQCTLAACTNLIRSELELRARRDWLERYVDQEFSLTDAVSFAVMRERGIEHVLTLDSHFAVAGFRSIVA